MEKKQPQPASGAKIFWNLLLAAFIFWAIKTLPDGYRLKAFLFLLFGTYFLITFIKLFFAHRTYSMVGAYLLFYVGGFLVFLFLIRTGNWLLALGFKVGQLFPEVYNFIFSFPALVSGLVLIAAALLWEHREPRFTALKNAFLLGK